LYSYDPQFSLRAREFNVSIYLRLILVVLVWFSPTAFVNSHAAENVAVALQQQIEADLASLDEVKVLGSVLSISMPGQEPVIVAYGYANLDRDTAISPKHLFQIGSQTKMFTAAAILLLQQQGSLDVDDLVSKYVAGVPRADELTVRQLLHHMGGIGDSIVFFDPPLGRRPDFEITFDNHLFLGRVAGEQFAPGEQWEYNNLGFVILGKVVEAASGQSLDRYIRKNILQPLGMNETYLGSLEAYPEDRMARAYFADKKSGDIVDTTMPDLSWASSAGDMVSSLADMRTWANALLDENNAMGISLGDFIADNVAVPDDGNLERYGFGMMRRKVGERSMWGHGGFIHGYVTLTLVEPSSGVVLQIMTNLEDDSEEIIPKLETVVADALKLVQVAYDDSLR